MPVNLVDGRVNEEGIARVSDVHVSKLARHQLLPGDIVFSRRGDVTRFALITERESGWLCGTGCLKVSLGEQGIATAEFVAGVLSLPESKEWLVQHAVGATMPNLNTTILSALPVRLPDLATQRGATSLLTVLTARMESLRQTNVTLEAIAQALFKSWFVDFDPVRAKAEGREPEGMDAATAALFPSEFVGSEFGPVPKGWATNTVGSVLAVLETGRRPKGGVARYTEGVPSIGAESIHGIGIFDYSRTRYVPPDFFDSMKSGKPRDFDVLLYKDGGKPGEFKPRLALFGDGFPFEEYALNEHVFMLRANDQLNSQPYLYFWLKEERQLDVLRSAGNKAAIPGINRGDLERVNVLVPNRDVLAEFDRTASVIIHRLLNGANIISRLASLRDTLLPRLISGKLRIPEAEALVDEVIG